MKTKILSINKDDFDIQPIRAGGPGGQHQNKTSSAIRMTHKESGVSVVSRDSKSQKSNLRNAFSRLVNLPEFKKWLTIEVARRDGTLKKIEDKVEESMQIENIKTEIFKNGKWVESNEEIL